MQPLVGRQRGIEQVGHSLFADVLHRGWSPAARADCAYVRGSARRADTRKALGSVASPARCPEEAGSTAHSEARSVVARNALTDDSAAAQFRPRIDSPRKYA